MDITAWNVNPNRKWYVRMADGSSGVSVEMYLTEAAAQARTGLQASGISSGYGSDLPVTLTAGSGAEVAISLFQDAYDWHLKVSGAAAESTVIYRVKEFVALDDIDHPIYRNMDLITTRATAEIDAHTHALIPKTIELGSHLPTLEPGDIVRLNSTRRGKNEMLQVMEHHITGEQHDSGGASLVGTLSLVSYLALRR